MSNYDIMAGRAKELFLSYDQEHMITKLSLCSDFEYIYITFVGRDYRIARKSGDIHWSDDGFMTCSPAGFNEVMTIYDVLCLSKDGCKASGDYCALGSIKGQVIGKTVGFDIISSAAAFFSGHTQSLAKACEALGGVREGKGDVAYKLPLFTFLPVRFQFWEADEEYPASLQFLWDKNIRDFLKMETIYYAADHILHRLRQLCHV